MSVFPGDVVSTSVGVLHVGSVIVERSRAGDSFAVSGVTGDGVVHSNVPIGEGMVSLAVDVSDGEALVWFDRERRLRRLGDAVFSPGEGLEALGRLVDGQAVVLSLTDREPADAVVKWLGEVEASLVDARDWVVERRAECLKAFEGFHAGWLKYQSKPWSEPELSEPGDIRLGVKFRSGGVYQFRRDGVPVEDGYEYFKVVSNNYNPEIILYGASVEVSECLGFIYRAEYRGGEDCLHLVMLAKVGGKNISIDASTVRLLPIGSFRDIDSYVELSEYDVSLPEALQEIFLDMFCAGEGKPKCLPYREELDGSRYYWADDYAKCRGVLMAATADLLFDIEKSIGYVRWLREQLVGFYRELGFTI